MINSVGQRGKYAEGLVKAYLKKLESVSFTHYRFPDARAGSFTVTPCDFAILDYGKLTMLEVKQVEHSFRLPYANYSKDQCARMRNWESAGANAQVLIYFTPEKLWRYESVGFFLNREEGKGSWDLKELELITLDRAFKEIL
jgi:penicillin-binding protein-related factor A (putative recombinase)